MVGWLENKQIERSCPPPQTEGRTEKKVIEDAENGQEGHDALEF